MKLTDYKNEDALDLLADILEPTTKILGDKDIQKGVKDGANKMQMVKTIIKNHKSDILEILARLDGKEPKDYTCNIVTLTTSVAELLDDKELMDFFQLQRQMMAQESSTSAMANTEEKGQ